MSLRERWRYWARLHITGMGLSYVMMLIAFYVDNGRQLPLWKDLSHFTYYAICAHHSGTVVVTFVTAH